MQLPSEKLFFIKQKKNDPNFTVGELSLPEKYKVTQNPGLFAQTSELRVIPENKRKKLISIPTTLKPDLPNYSDQELKYRTALMEKGKLPQKSAFEETAEASKLAEETALKSEIAARRTKKELAQEALLQAVQALPKAHQAPAHQALLAQIRAPPVPAAAPPGSPSSTAKHFGISAADTKMLDDIVDNLKLTSTYDLTTTHDLNAFKRVVKKEWDDLNATSSSAHVPKSGYDYAKLRYEGAISGQGLEGGDLSSLIKSATKVYNVGKKVYDVLEPVVKKVLETDAGKKVVSQVGKKLFGGDLPTVVPWWENSSTVGGSMEKKESVIEKLESIKNEIPKKKFNPFERKKHF